jgi:hypothetical protein
MNDSTNTKKEKAVVENTNLGIMGTKEYFVSILINTIVN